MLLRSIGTIAGWMTGKERSGVEARLRGILYSLVLRSRQLRIGRNVHFVSPRNMRIGSGVTFHGNTYVNAANPKGSLSIGDGSHFDQYCVLYAQGGLSIGAKCALAAGVAVYTQTNQYKADEATPVVDQPVQYAPVSIGDDVWVGAHAVILPGVSIGDHAVVAAGAVVRNDVGRCEIVAGVPARLVGSRNWTA
jgi:acetyltransferase-like isoleucine patch superfamily enzyme